MSDEPVNPLREAAKQFYRDNPDKALQHHGRSNLVIGGLLAMSVIAGLLIKWLGIPPEHAALPAVFLISVTTFVWSIWLSSR